MVKSDLISPEYCALNAELHRSPRGFGHSGQKHAGEVLAVCNALDLNTVLDYGCGAGTLNTALSSSNSPLVVSEYDPAIPGKDDLAQLLPRAFDLIACTDVLEHVEPDRLSAVFEHFQYLKPHWLFAVIALTESSKWLPDGRNAHIHVQPGQWWAREVRLRGWRINSYFVRQDKSLHEPVDITIWAKRNLQ